MRVLHANCIVNINISRQIMQLEKLEQLDTFFLKIYQQTKNPFHTDISDYGLYARFFLIKQLNLHFVLVSAYKKHTNVHGRFYHMVDICTCNLQTSPHASKLHLQSRLGSI